MRNANTYSKNGGRVEKVCSSLWLWRVDSALTQDFEFQNFMKGLEWFANSGCIGCLRGGGMPNCEVRNCCTGKGLKNCYSCKDFVDCKKLSYQKETYKVDESYGRIKRIGYEKWLKEQEEKLKEDFDNIYFLEKFRKSAENV